MRGFERTIGLMAAVALLVTLGACGFKLRGSVEIPPELNPMYIEASGGTRVRAALLQRLEFSDVRLAPAPRDARIIVRILDERITSRVAAVDRNGKVIASELTLSVSFDAIGPDGAVRVPRQSLSQVRTYTNPDVEVLGKQLEAALIYEELAQDAADQVLARLRAALL